MGIDLTNQKARAKQARKRHKKLYHRLHRIKGAKVDDLFRDADEAAFACIDCLECANCCKTTGPLFSARDISRISEYINISEAEFENQYLRIDEDEDFVLRTLPCPFLDLTNNQCTIYDVRPRACAEYPHTHQDNQLKRKQLTLKNAEICPAVLDILDRLDAEI